MTISAPSNASPSLNLFADGGAVGPTAVPAATNTGGGSQAVGASFGDLLSALDAADTPPGQAIDIAAMSVTTPSGFTVSVVSLETGSGGSSCAADGRQLSDQMSQDLARLIKLVDEPPPDANGQSAGGGDGPAQNAAQAQAAGAYAQGQGDAAPDGQRLQSGFGALA